MGEVTFYRSKDNSIVDQDGKQIAVVLPVACSKKLAREMAAFAAQQANHDAKQKERTKRAKETSHA